MVYVTDQGFAVKPASHILRMLRAVTAPPMIHVGSLSGVAATLLCFGERAAGRNVGPKLCILTGWGKNDSYLPHFADNECILILYGELRV
jgi:hypothetical protein